MNNQIVQVSTNTESRLEKTARTAYRIEGAISMCNAEEKARLSKAFAGKTVMVQRQRYNAAGGGVEDLDYVDEQPPTSKFIIKPLDRYLLIFLQVKVPVLNKGIGIQAKGDHAKDHGCLTRTFLNTYVITLVCETILCPRQTQSSRSYLIPLIVVLSTLVKRVSNK
jgi:hypothetical protein